MTAIEHEQEKRKRSVFKPLAALFLVFALFVGACGCRSSLPPPVTVHTLRLYLSMSDNEDDLRTSLKVDGMQGMRPTTFAEIPTDLTQGVGDKSDRENYTYFALSFYVINASDCAVFYETTVKITRSTGEVVDAVRVLAVDDDNPIAEGDIYAKEERSQAGKDILAEKTSYSTTPFVSDSVVYIQSGKTLAQNDRVKQTYIIWLEGWDVDCNDAILAQSFSIGIDISASDEEQTEQSA